MTDHLIGHNRPPHVAIELAEDALKRLGDWLNEHPIIITEDDAKEAKLVHDATKEALRELEAERDGYVRPLNEQVKAINERYKAARTPVERLMDELKNRLNAYLEAERKRREEEARRAAEELARKEAEARAAEAREREAIENAAVGEFTDVAGATAEADEKFSEYERARREAERKAREAESVKVAGGFGRALSQRKTEKLVVEDPVKALRAIINERGGILPEKIEAAIVSAARDYRKAKGKLPNGVVSHVSATV